jgi:hypothetical protein
MRAPPEPGRPARDHEGRSPAHDPGGRLSRAA